MENINSFNDSLSNANLLRNANFSTLQESTDRFIDDEKDIRGKIEGATLPFEVPVLEHTLGNLGKKALVKAGLRSEEDEDGIVKSLGKKGLKAILKKIQGDDVPDVTPPAPAAAPAAAPATAPAAQPAAQPTAAGDSDEVKNLKRLQQEAEDQRDQTASDLEDAKSAVTDATADVAVKEQAVQDAETIVEGNARRAVSQAGGRISQSQQVADANDRSSLNDARTDLDNAKSGLDDANQNVSDTQDLLDTHSNLADQAKSDVENATKTTVEGEAEGQAEKTGAKTLAEKLAEKAGMAEVEGGGPEDIGGDIVAAGLAIGSLFASIFGKKIKKPDPTAQLPALQLKVTQGFGLAGN